MTKESLTASVTKLNSSNFSLGRDTDGEPSEFVDTIPVGRILGKMSKPDGAKFDYGEFGLLAVWQTENGVFAVVRAKTGMFYRNNGKSESHYLKAGQERNIALPAEGIRIVKPQTLEDILIKFNNPPEEMPIGSKQTGPEPTLSESVSLQIPK